MSTRRYNEAEVAAIFERATEAQHASPTPSASGEGMSLAELQEIGREVGISAESIALAARTLGQGEGEGEAPRSRTVLGLPVGVARTVYLDRKLTEEEWERIVVHLRETFNARGVVKAQGSLRQWTNGNLQALLEPTESGHRIRLRTTKGGAAAGMMGGIVLAAVSAAGLIAGVVQGDPASLSTMGPVGVAGVAMFAWTALRLPGWARTRRGQMEEVAARVAATTGPVSE
jgi:hypothetical protein